MTTAVRPPEIAPSRPRVLRRPRSLSMVALVVAVVAGAALLAHAPHRTTPAPAGRLAAAVAWPHAQRADIPAHLSDGPIFTPLDFIDAHTALGTAPTPNGTGLRLLIRQADGSVRLLRSRTLRGNPDFGNATLSGTTLAWTESVASRPLEIWTADLREGAASRVTTDTGDAVFYGSQYDLVIADGQVYWTARTDHGTDTQIRSVAVTGGAVHIRTERGAWGLTAWPWIVEGGPENMGSTRLRQLIHHDEVEVPLIGGGLTCTPVWCRVMVQSSTGLAHIDLMHPDGSGRRRVAGSGAVGAITDVALLNRFEILSEAQPDSDLTGTERILVYDLRTSQTVDLGAGISGIFARGPVLWWPTGDQETMQWHTVDLRTV
jgi:hypothetical protein